MRQQLWKILCVASIIWAVSVSVLYWRLKSNPRVIAVTTDMTGHSESLQNFQLGEMEKLTFVRQFLDRYFNYDSNNFWQSQTSLSFLMAPDLREKRIQEVQRLREKIQVKSLNQHGQLLSLITLEPDSYRALVVVQISEGSNKNSELFISLNLKVSSTERTLENPWGLLVTTMDFLQSSPQKTLPSNNLSIKEKAPLVIIFPCAIENIESSPESTLETKITTLNVSEIQLFSKTILQDPVEMTALCKDREYHFTINGAHNEADLFRSFVFDTGTVRKKESSPGKPAKKDIYEKTIENVLGI
ncbi:MAG: hypothetical protein ACM3MG_11690, partial [Bacillota bacterium]